MVATPAEIATRAEEYKTGFLALQIGIVALCVPGAPVLHIVESLGTPRRAPIVMKRADDSTHSSEPLEDVLLRAAGLPGAGFRGDALPLARIVQQGERPDRGRGAGTSG
jgi:hypothetical protein